MRVRTEAKREPILDTAAEVFMELGFERASMSEIAARMGGSKPPCTAISRRRSCRSSR